MKFGPVAVDNAKGGVLAHAVNTANGRLKKGKILQASDIVALKQSGIDNVVIARLETDDIDENSAAKAIAKALLSSNVYSEKPFTGRANLFARHSGLLKVNRNIVDQINRIDAGITIATLSDMKPVEAGRMIATVKIIPFAVARQSVNLAQSVVAHSVAFELQPFAEKRIGLIATRLPSLKHTTMDKTRDVLDARLRKSGSRIIDELRVGHSAGAVADAIGQLQSKCDLIILFGASAIIDEADIIPDGLRLAGGLVKHLGMPVDPGNLLMFGEIGQIPVIGAPGCARSARENGFDWILQRVLANVPITAGDIQGMGVGGLLMEIHSRPQPRHPVIGNNGEVHGLILAAGQSRRMGKTNKLLATLDGKTLVRRTTEAAIASGLAKITVITGHEAEKIEQALAGLDVKFVHNPDYGSGLASSLRCGIGALPEKCSSAMILLADMPNISSQMIDQMVQAYKNAGDRTIVLATSHGKRGNPVLWSSSYFDALKNISGDVGARHLIGENADQVIEVELGDAAALDIDTPAELHKQKGELSKG